MAQDVKQFTIVSRGRKYFTCRLGKATAKVLINQVVADLQPGQSAELAVNDWSQRNRYGVDRMFEPVQVVGDIMTDAERHARNTARRETERWMSYAEADAAMGRYSTNAIHHALASDISDLSDRRQALRDHVEANRKAAHAADETERRQRAAQRAADAAARERRRANRHPVLVENRPHLNVPVRLSPTRVVVYESFGQSWILDEDTHNMGFHPSDVGKSACYAYYRPATDEEIATLPDQVPYPVEQIEAHRYDASDDQGDRYELWGVVYGCLVHSKGYDRDGMTPEAAAQLAALPWERVIDDGRETWRSIPIAEPTPAMREALQVGTRNRVPSVESLVPGKFR